MIGAAHYALELQHPARPVIVWGVSMGAAAALMVAAESPDIAAVISDSSFLSLSDTVRHHWRLFFHLPSFPIADEVLCLLAWRGGFWPSDFDLVKAVSRIGDRPILFVALENDRRMPPSIARGLYSTDQYTQSSDRSARAAPRRGVQSGHGSIRSRSETIPGRLAGRHP